MFATLFEGADSAGVVDALRGYQNADGGFGHGLEPDKRCPDSLALDAEAAFDNLLAMRRRDDEMVRRACDWLQSVATPEGAVSLASPAIEGYPRAEHMSEWTYVPGLNPTAGLVGGSTGSASSTRGATRLPPGARRPWPTTDFLRTRTRCTR